VKKICPVCGKTMEADGYNIPIESIWGVDGKKGISIEYEVDFDFIPVMKKALEKHYPDCTVAYWTDAVSEDSCDNTEERNVEGFLIFSKDFNVYDYPNFKVDMIAGNLYIQEYWDEAQRPQSKVVRISVRESAAEKDSMTNKNVMHKDEIKNQQYFVADYSCFDDINHTRIPFEYVTGQKC
jgi:hypothetical protein